LIESSGRVSSLLACGYALANAGHDTRALQAWLGHKNIQHTVRYTELAPDRFKDFWRS
jgi:site-specific recombinase XerD